jgi:UDPglucose--hexose-1-phosphate uridylyltransferase
MSSQINPNDASRGVSNQLRNHYYLDRSVIITPHRGLRPYTYPHPLIPHVTSDTASCNFCSNSDEALYRVPAKGDWQVKVVANEFPILMLHNSEAYGSHEVLIETPDNREFSELTHAHQLMVLSAYRHRLSALNALPGIRYVQILKNDGMMAGASMAHAHSQILALPFVPPRIFEESQGQDSYRKRHGTCAVCDVVAWEEQQTVRIVYADKYVVALAPYASSSPYGVWVIPRRHEGQFSNARTGELDSFATVLGVISAQLDASSIDFNWLLLNSLSHEDHHYMWKIEPRQGSWSGFEMGTGVAVNTVSPEYAALWYKGKI